MFIGEALKGIFIFLLASVLLASFAKATGLDQQISMVFSGHPFKAIIVASLGALSPFCSCGVVPIIAGLLMAGVPLAPVMAFLFCVTTHGPFHVPAYGTCLRVRIHASQANLCNNYRHYCRLGSPSFQGSSFAVITLTRPQS